MPGNQTDSTEVRLKRRKVQTAEMLASTEVTAEERVSDSSLVSPSPHSASVSPVAVGTSTGERTVGRGRSKRSGRKRGGKGPRRGGGGPTVTPFEYTRPASCGRLIEHVASGSQSAEDKTSADYYFDSYAHFGIHEEMLKDHVRTDAYRRAITKNAHLFKDKVVLDIGAGTGILCMFAAQAGASHVYGIECAGIATHAKKIVAENGFADKITIVHGKVEEIELPVEKVDVIISEWMGYFLIYESMLDTVIYARDKWLRDGGTLMPDKGRMCLLAIEDAEYKEEKIGFWDDVWGFKMSSLKAEAMKEPLVDLCPAKSVVTNNYTILDIDLYTVKKEDLDFESSFKLQVKRDDYVHAFAAYFDVYFSKCHTRTGLTTAPWQEPTHWKQTIFYLDQPLVVERGSQIVGKISAKRNAKNPRDLDILLESHFAGSKMPATTQVRTYCMR